MILGMILAFVVGLGFGYIGGLITASILDEARGPKL